MKRLNLLAIFVLLIACNNGKDKPDVSSIKVDVRIERFEPVFFAIDTNNVASGLAKLRNQFPRFYPFFMQQILQLHPADTAAHTVVRSIITSYAGLYDSLQMKYRSLDALKRELTESFRFVKHYYPSYSVPSIITYLATLYAPGVVLTPDYIGIGLHQFAGKNFLPYKDDQVQQLYPSYISRRFDKEYMAVNCMRAVVDDVYPDQSTGKPLIEQIVEKGKQWFLLDHFLPDSPDSVKTGYTKKQMEWVKENEGNIWSYLVKNENLYSIEPPTIQTYIGEAPFTQGMPESSPGNLGQWIGWRIVQKYAAENKKLTVPQILQTPATTIFNEARYRPK